MGTRIRAGRYYLLDDRATEVLPQEPDAVVCRRVVDWPVGKPLPPGTAFGTCVQCCAWVLFEAAGPHPEKPRVCQRCAGIVPA